MINKLSGKETLVIGLMLFALFLGAGNMIFPPAMGQNAGEHVWAAILGFLITGVGLPFLGILAIAFSGSDIQSLSEKVHPKFGTLFPILLYLTIGPFFGIPRTGTVAYEIGITPFLPQAFNNNGLALLISTLLFFGLTFWLSLNPSKLVDRIGKILTPILILILIILTTKAFFSPLGQIQSPKEEYINGAFFKGFLEGYLTMDTLGALVFGIVIISAIKDRGVTTRKEITMACIKAGIIAAIGLTFVYVSLSYIGATSVESLGYLDNGGAILSGAANSFFGSLGNLVLGLAITFACLTTSVGLVSACGNYLKKAFPAVSYSWFVFLITLFSTCIANFGLSQLIAVSIPLLVTIYPLAIVLIILSFIDAAIGLKPIVYILSLTATVIFSSIDGLQQADINIAFFDVLRIIPFYEIGMGWFVPSIVGAIIGMIVSSNLCTTKK